MAPQRIVVEIELGIEADDLAVLGDDERVDLQKAHVLGEEGVIEALDHLADLLGLVALEPQRHGDLVADIGRITGSGLDLEGVDLLRRGMGHRLDVHAAFGRNDEGDAAGFAVDQRRQVKLARDGRAVLDIEALDEAAFGAGLVGDESHAEHARRFRLHVFDGLHHLDAAALAAAARVNLRLDHPYRAGKGLGGLDRFGDAEGREALRHGHAEPLQHFFRLIFVDVHEKPLKTTGRKWGTPKCAAQ